MIRRFYESLIQNHIDKYDQMIFISGPRQVGKTTIAKVFATSEESYLNWDNVNHRETILSRLYEHIDTQLLSTVSQNRPSLILDEIHKYPDWKNLIKGVFDQYKGQLTIIVTGSAKLDVYAKGGDSLMGRYFNYQIFPLTAREVMQLDYEKKLVNTPVKPKMRDWNCLYEMGGYPEPYTKHSEEFHTLWTSARLNQLFREEIRDYANVQNIAQLELLGKLIANQAGSQTNYSQLAKKIQVSEATVRSWYKLLENTYYCFNVHPWSRNISRSILKVPKTYLCDWSLLEDEGARIENLCALHLLKAIHYWRNTGQGDFSLHYLRNKDKREVDFLVSKNNEPWLMVEVKKSAKTKLSDNLSFYQSQLNVPHVFQVAFDLAYVDIDLFSLKSPKIVPMKTFLMQLF